MTIQEEKLIVSKLSIIVVAVAGCFWSGTSPFCFGKCGHFYSTIAVNKRGDGKTCLTGTKKLCCPRTNLKID